MARVNWDGPVYHSQNGRYYCYGTDTNGNKHILDGDSQRDLQVDYLGELSPGGLHDHHYTRNGRWYTQTRVDSGHLFDGGGIESDAGNYLDHLFDELRRLG
jgi:hypothetical protein